MLDVAGAERADLLRLAMSAMPWRVAAGEAQPLDRSCNLGLVLSGLVFAGEESSMDAKPVASQLHPMPAPSAGGQAKAIAKVQPPRSG